MYMGLTQTFSGTVARLGNVNQTVTVLENGITVVTETPSIPSTVTMKVLLDVGTRNEKSDTSGALLSIKNSYLKTVLNTNETVN
jgi:predicted Zn-dependent peptidase